MWTGPHNWTYHTTGSSQVTMAFPRMQKLEIFNSQTKQEPCLSHSCYGAQASGILFLVPKQRCELSGLPSFTSTPSLLNASLGLYNEVKDFMLVFISGTSRLQDPCNSGLRPQPKPSEQNSVAAWRPDVCASPMGQGYYLKYPRHPLTELLSWAHWHGGNFI